jgi:NADH-quinone oxidoreductase subunit I
MSVFGRFKEDIINSFVSIVKGHRITWRNMWRERQTLQYPDERPELPERYRGIPGVHPEVCIVCGACAKACPVQIITMEGKKIAGTKHRELTQFSIEAGRCMFCGLCEEACPTKGVKAIRLSNVYELANENKTALVLNMPELLAIWKTKPDEVPEEEYLANSPRRLAERDLAAKASGEAPAPKPGAKAGLAAKKAAEGEAPADGEAAPKKPALKVLPAKAADGADGEAPAPKPKAAPTNGEAAPKPVAAKEEAEPALAAAAAPETTAGVRPASEEAAS